VEAWVSVARICYEAVPSVYVHYVVDLNPVYSTDVYVSSQKELRVPNFWTTFQINSGTDTYRMLRLSASRSGELQFKFRQGSWLSWLTCQSFSSVIPRESCVVP